MGTTIAAACQSAAEYRILDDLAAHPQDLAASDASGGTDLDDPLAVARGLILGLHLGVGAWAIVAFAVYVIWLRH